MKTGRIVKTSSDDFCKMINVPDEVMDFFDKLAKKYRHRAFVIEINPTTWIEETKADIEIEIYDDYRE